MKTLNVKKVDSEACEYYNDLKAKNLMDEDMIIFTKDCEFRVASSSLVKLSSEKSKNILRAYRIDSLGNLWVA